MGKRQDRHRSTHHSLFGLLLVLVVAGCGGVSSSVSQAPATTAIGPATAAPATAAPATGSPTATSAAAVGFLDAELVTPGRFTYCANLRPGRMGFRDENGKPAGVNIEIAIEFARRLGLQPELRETPFEALIADVAGSLCDISISSEHITQSRLERIDMVPYVQGTQHVIVRIGNPAGIERLTDLCGRRLAVQTGSTHVDLVLGQGDHSGAGIDRDCVATGQPKVDLRQFDDDADAIEALADGNADAYIGSDPIVVDRPIEFELTTALPPIRNGIGVAKHHPALRAAVDGALQAMITDGTYVAILDRFGVLSNSIAN